MQETIIAINYRNNKIRIKAFTFNIKAIHSFLLIIYLINFTMFFIVIQNKHTHKPICVILYLFYFILSQK